MIYTSINVTKHYQFIAIIEVGVFQLCRYLKITFRCPLSNIQMSSDKRFIIINVVELIYKNYQ